MRILHTMLQVGDLDRSIEVLHRRAGHELLARKGYPDGKFTLAFVGYGDERDNTVIELTYNWGVDRYDLGGGYGHIALEVDDVYRASRRNPPIGRQDHPRRRADERRHDPHRLRRGPDGYPIELIGRR